MSLRNEPHYRIDSVELAAWLEGQGADRWWSVDGDPLLTGRLSFPCPADELAAELRRINKPLLVQDRRVPPQAHGERIGAGDLDAIVTRLGDNDPRTGPKPAWAKNRLLGLNWEHRGDEWLLVEDEETTQESREDAVAHGNK